MDPANAQARARIAKSAQKSAAVQQERSSMSVDLDLYMSRMAMLMVSLVSPPLSFVFRFRSRFYVTSSIVNISRHSISIVVSGYRFFSFLVRAFCMRMLNSIHDEIDNRSFAS